MQIVIRDLNRILAHLMKDRLIKRYTRRTLNLFIYLFISCLVKQDNNHVRMGKLLIGIFFTLTISSLSISSSIESIK